MKDRSIEHQYRELQKEWNPGRYLVGVQGWKVVGGPFWNPLGPTRPKDEIQGEPVECRW